jgi:hypothetical protein
MKRCFRKGLFWLPATLFLLLLCNLRAQAHVYFITETNDTTEVTSLRGAVIDANHRGGDNIIMLGREERREGHDRPAPEWTFHLTIPGANEGGAYTGDLDVTNGDLTILGVGGSVMIDATGLGDRVFHVWPHARLTLADLIITGGVAPVADDEAGPINGGAVWNEGELVLERCCITNNSSGVGLYPVYDWLFVTGGDGGGIYNAGTAILKGCIITSNSGANGEYYIGEWVCGYGGNGGNGGGIYNCGTMVLDDCLVSNNRSGNGGPGGIMEGDLCGQGMPGGGGGGGAGIFNLGTLSVETCTVSGNWCGNGGDGGEGECFGGGSGGDGGGGGGIYSAGPLELTSCTIAFNEAGTGGNGGNGNYGYQVDGNGGITFDVVPGANGGAGGSGGGVLSVTNSGISLRNTLVALNSTGTGGLGGTNVSDPWLDSAGPPAIGALGSDGSSPDLAGAFASQGYNLIGMGDGCTGLTNRREADQVGSVASPIDPLLGPLAMNGGLTPTHALLWGSPAIDQGKCFGIHEDQRGQYRPFVYPSIPKPPGGDGSDIGAFELHPAATHER